MLQHRNKLIIILVLSVISGYFFFSNKSDHFSKTYTDINVSDTSAIDEIRIIYDTTSVILNKNNGFWYLNNTIPARSIGVSGALKILNGLQLIAPASDANADSIYKQIENRGLCVKLFQNSKQIKQYKIGNKSKFIEGTYVVVDDNKTPLIVEALGGYFPLHRVFSPFKHHWRDATIFRYHVSDIKSVQLEYTNDKDNSYKLIIGADKSTKMKNLDGSMVVESLDDNAVFNYLSYFSNVSFERIASEFSQQQIDSVKQLKPEVVLTIEDRKSNKNCIKTYLKPNLNPKTMDKYKFDIYRMYGVVNDNNEVVIVQYQSFDPLYRQPAYFVGSFKK